MSDSTTRSRFRALPMLSVTTALICGLAAPPAEAMPTPVGVPGGSGVASASHQSVSREVDEWELIDRDEHRTSVRLAPQEDSAAAAVRENRHFRHSDLQATGRFAERGERLELTVEDGAEVDLALGLYGEYEGLNDGADVGVERIPLATGRSELVATRDGMIFLVNRSAQLGAVVDVRGGRVMPMFVLGDTTDKDFDRQLAESPDAPFVTLVSGRTLGDFQSELIRKYRSAVTADRLASWDDAARMTDEVAGLLPDGTGTGRKSTNRIYFANPERGDGFATAGSGRLRFVNANGGGAAVFGHPVDDQWTLWHEIGHTYQTPQYRLDGLGEVTVNISAQLIQERLAGVNGLDRATIRAEVGRHRLTPVAERRFADLSDGPKTLMFDQLRRAFGDGFYPRLNQRYRVMDTLGELRGLDDAAREQRFMVTAAAAADRDLGPFFAEWGMVADEATAANMAAHPPLATTPWNLMDRATDVMEVELAPYALPTAVLADHALALRLGASTAGDAELLVTDLGSTDGDAAMLAELRVSADQAGTANGRVTAILRSRDIEDVQRRTVDVTPGTSMRLYLDGRWTLMTVALDSASSRLHVYSTGNRAPDSWAGKDFISLAVHDADGRLRARQAVSGGETADAIAAAFGGMAYQDGDHLVVEHVEAASMLVRYVDDERVPASDAVIQRYRIEGSQLVPVVALPEPAWPFSLDAPSDGAEVTSPFPSFSGDGVPGATVGLTDESGSHIGSTTVSDAGRWRLEPTVPLLPGLREVEAAMSGTAGDDRTPVRVRLTVVEAGLAVATPAAGRPVPERAPRFTGVGDPGASIAVQTADGASLGDTVVALDGSWSIVAGSGLPVGAASTVVEQRTVHGVVSTVPVDFEIVDERPVTVTAPVGGAAVRTPHPTFEGTGQPGAAIIVRMAHGTIALETTVDEDGRWQGVAEQYFRPGAATVSVEQFTALGVRTEQRVGFVVEEVPPHVEEPVRDSVVATPFPRFAGIGDPGAGIVVKTTYGTVVLETTVQEDGRWGGESQRAMSPKAYTGTVVQTSVSGARTTTDFAFTVEVVAPELLVPAPDSIVATDRPTFEGSGEPGASIVLRTAYGTRIVDTTVEADGRWRAESLVSLDPKAYTGTLTQRSIAGEVTTVPFAFVVTPEAAFAIVTPAAGERVVGEPPVFTGTGVSGAVVELRSADGSLLASAVIVNGVWRIPWDWPLEPGEHHGTAVQIEPDGTRTMP